MFSCGSPVRACWAELKCCRVEIICGGILLRFLLQMFKIAKIQSQIFQWLYSDDEFLQKFFDRKNFPIQVSCYFCKYFPVQNNSSLQYGWIVAVGGRGVLSYDFSKFRKNGIYSILSLTGMTGCISLRSHSEHSQFPNVLWPWLSSSTKWDLSICNVTSGACCGPWLYMCVLVARQQ